MGEKDLNKKEKNILMISSLVVVLALVLGISFAYFMAQDVSEEQIVTTATLAIDYDDGNSTFTNASGLKPIMRDEVLTKAAKKTFTIKNTGTEKSYVHISLEDMVIPEDLKRYDFVWSLYEGDTNVSNGTFAGATTSMKIGEYLVFEAPTTEDGVTTYDEKTYNLYIWIDETGVDQSDMMGETFKTTIQAESEAYWTSPESDFTVTEAGVLTKYTGTDKTVVIPPVVNGVTVTEIGAGDYNYVYNLEADENGIITIVIPNTVNRINDTAFMELGSMLDGKINFIIPNSVTYIGYGAFLNSDIYNISIPNSVTHLGVESFSVNNLTSIFIPNTVTEIGGQSFSNNNLGGVVIPSSVTNVSADESGLFWYNKNSDLIITVQGKSSTPNTFFEGWNLKESGAETFTTVYVP